MGRICSARYWASASFAALALAACGGGQERAAPTATASPARDCRGAAALANGCPETDAVERGAARGTPCERTAPLGLVEPCVFGREGGETFALIGDSHANALRSAFTAAAETLGRRGYAITRNGCPYVRDGRALPEPDFSECATWKRQVPEWLARHPEVTTVFVIGLPRNAASQDPALWTAAWDALPVRRIVAVRDTPELRADTLACVKAAATKPGSTCAVPRAEALPPDPALAAAAQRGAPVIDLSDRFCDQDRCFPVIGGVLAYQDLTHVTPAFAATLGPFLVNELQQLG